MLSMINICVLLSYLQSSGPIHTGTSCNDNNKDSRKKVNKGNPNVNVQERTKDNNDDNISIHASGDEIEDNNANKKEQGYNVTEVGDQDPLSSYSSKVRSDDEEYDSDDDDERGKCRYQDLSDSVQEEMFSPIESEFEVVCRKI